jgi:DNA-binding response OmpR family regulator
MEQFAMRARLLCVGNGLDHLQSRCAVLGIAGYDAKSAALPEAETLLRTEQFDLIILSAWLEEWDRGRILAAAGKTPVLVLTELTLAEDLLVKVAKMLQTSRQAAAQERR